MGKIKGCIIPCSTPFDEEGNLRLDWLEFNISKWNESTVAGYMCLGTNAEFKSMDDAESLEVVKTFVKCKAPGKLLIAGVGRESLVQTKRFIQLLADNKLPIDYISVITPCYFKGLMTDEALIEYFTAVADFSPYPVLLYCAPSYVNEVTISVPAIKALADHPNIYGIKDTSKTMMDDYLAAVGGRDDFQVMAGSISNSMKCFAGGGTAGVFSGANYFPDENQKLCDIFFEKGYDAAAEYHADLAAFIKNTGARGGVAGVHAVMNLQGFKAGVPRKPVLPMKEEMIQEISEYIAARQK